MPTQIKYIIREVEPEWTNFSLYFEDDGLTGVAGDFCYNLFIVARSRNCGGFNEKTYKRVYDEIELLVDEWEKFKYAKENGHEPNYSSFSDIVRWNAHYDRGGHYVHSLKNTRKLSELKKFIEWLYEPSKLYGYKNRVNWEANEEGCIAKYLTIATGKAWGVDDASGYCQGDYVKMVYCLDHYKDGVKPYGEIWLGAAKEFYVITLDEDGEEGESCGGFIIADCQIKNWRESDSEYKRIVCEWDGINPEETRLEMIDGSRTYTKYTYRIA